MARVNGGCGHDRRSRDRQESRSLDDQTRRTMTTADGINLATLPGLLPPRLEIRLLRQNECACAWRDNQTHGIKARCIASNSWSSYSCVLSYGVLMVMPTGLADTTEAR
jgi:hypothetical protein